MVETRRRDNHHFKWPFEFYQAQFIFDWEKELSPRWFFKWALCWYFLWFYWTRGWKDFDFWLVLGTHLFQKYTESMMRRHLITPWFQKMSVNKSCSKWRSQRDSSKSEMIDFLSYELISSGILEVSSCHSSLTLLRCISSTWRPKTVSAYFYLIILNTVNSPFPLKTRFQPL